MANKTNKMISISFEIAEKLRLEENASELIEKLLTAYFRPDANTINLEIMSLEAQKQALAGDLQAIEAKEAESQKTRATQEIKQREMEKERRESPESKERAKEIMKFAWDSYDSTPEEFEKFYEDYEKGLFKNIAVYCEANGIKKREKK